ncbi:hypothetical protein SPLC1_S051300 [Arthrospira platensis C1]|uniref:Uncharacterized protein n=1 Tax=Limnospira indica PCC 8005 TaxID=376219 RepID=A0A9P1KD95_9CYAN|nr:hypothetical protein SPLC1_S051300 [Arthrospira platensis C1]CDM93455.1 conserved protein of unknown function [Limnospira indica PCC 8005]
MSKDVGFPKNGLFGRHFGKLPFLKALSDNNKISVNLTFLDSKIHHG